MVTWCGSGSGRRFWRDAAYSCVCRVCVSSPSLGLATARPRGTTWLGCGNQDTHTTHEDMSHDSLLITARETETERDCERVFSQSSQCLRAEIAHTLHTLSFVLLCVLSLSLSRLHLSMRRHLRHGESRDRHVRLHGYGQARGRPPNLPRPTFAWVLGAARRGPPEL